jgi:hypothetical protein
VPAEILAYLDQSGRFCRWYVEVAWQRLAEVDKTPELARHWARFGNITAPANKKVPVPDAFDDWRGIQQVHLRPGSIAQELKRIGSVLIRGQMNQVFTLLDSLPKRTNLVNRRW